MDWTEWNGKRIFLRTIQGKVYSGDVCEIDLAGSNLIFLSLIDKFSNKVTVAVSQIIEIKEEKI